MHAHGFLGRDPEGVDQPGHFAARIADRFASLHTQRLGQFVEALAKTHDAVIQNRLPLVGGERCHGRGRLDRGRDPAIDRGRIRECDLGDDRAGVLVGDRQGALAIDRLIREVVRIACFDGGHEGLRVGLRIKRRRPRKRRSNRRAQALDISI